MRNIIIFLLLANTCFSQVFEEDESFKFSGVSKTVASPKVSAINLPSGKVIFSHLGTFINDSLQTTTFLWDPNTEKVDPFVFFENNFNEPLYSSQLSNTGEFLFYKSHSYPDNATEESTLAKIDLEGHKIEGFDFREQGFLFKVMELADGKILARFGDNSYKIYSSSGKFESVFSLSAYGFGDNVTLNDIVFSDGFYYFLLIQNDSGKVSIKRTDNLLANPKNLSLPSLDNSSAPQNKLFNLGNKIYLYTSSLNDQDNHLFEFDEEGNSVRDIKFGKVGNYMSSLPEVFWSDTGDISFKYHENDWIRINKDNSYKIYPKELGIINFQKNGLFLTRDGLDTYETDFEHDSEEKQALKFTQKLDFKPTKVFASENGIRLVEYSLYPQSSSMIYYSIRPTLVQLFDTKGKEIAELYDKESVWQSSTQGDFVLVKGNKKIYVLDSSDVLSEYENKWPTGSQFDLKHENVYYNKVFNENGFNFYELIKTDLEGVIDIDFKYKTSVQFSSFQFLPETQEISLFSLSAQTKINFLSPLTGDVLRVIPTKNYYNELIPTENGTYLRNVSVGGNGGYSYRLGKLSKDSEGEADFEQIMVLGGQFYLEKKDGSIIFNSLGLSPQNGLVSYYNALKLLPDGQIDRNFSILGKEPIIHFSEQNADTMFITTSSGLHRFIKNDAKEAPYLYIESELENDVPWNEVQPIYFKVHSSDSLYTLELTDNLKIEKDSLYIEAKPGHASIVIRSDNGYFSYVNSISIKKVKPEFSKHFSELRALQGPTWLRFSSSSGEPVYIKSGDSQPEYRDSILVDPNGSWNRINLYLRVGENELYSSAQENLVLDVLSPLANKEPLKKALPYPNPSRGTFLVPFENINFSAMELMNIGGQKISFSYEILSNGLKLHVPHYAPGVHILSLTERNKKHIYKLMLE